MTKEMNDIFVLAGQEEDRNPYAWEGMPEYVQKDKDAYDEITVRFRNQEDLEAFAALVDQPNLSLGRKNRKSCWYPKNDRMANSLMRWFDENDMDDEKVRVDYEDE